MSKPWEKRGVWCSGEKDAAGWLDIYERDGERVEIEISDSRGFTKSITLTREQALTFAANMMNLARRSRT